MMLRRLQRRLTSSPSAIELVNDLHGRRAAWPLIEQRAEKQAAMAAALSRAKAASRKVAALSEGAHVELSVPDAAVLAKLQATS